MNKRIVAALTGLAIAFTFLIPPTPTQHANAATMTWDSAKIGNESKTFYGNSSLADGTVVYTNDVEVRGYSDDGMCVAVPPCYYVQWELCSVVWRIGGSGNQYGSTHWAHYVGTWKCPICGQTGTCSTGNLSDGQPGELPVYVNQQYFTSKGAHPYHYAPNYESATESYETAYLCTENLTEEHHAEATHKVVSSRRLVKCSCGSTVGYYTFYKCSVCGKELTQGVTHNAGSQTSSGCGYSLPGSWYDHDIISVTRCDRHRRNDVHFYIYGNELGVGENYSVAHIKKIKDMTQSISWNGYYCSLCKCYCERFHESVYYSPQEAQTITATLSATSVGYGCVCPTLTVSGAQTSLTYSSSNTSVATISSSGVISLVGVGSTTFTVKAAETSDWTSATTSTTLTVTKGNLTVKTAPTASSISYGQSLTSSSLTGGSTTNSSGIAVGGSFAWKSPGTVPDSGGSKVYVVRFTPTDTTNYSY